MYAITKKIQNNQTFIHNWQIFNDIIEKILFLLFTGLFCSLITQLSRFTWQGHKIILENINLLSKSFLFKKVYSTKLDKIDNMNSDIVKILETINKLNEIGKI